MHWKRLLSSSTLSILLLLPVSGQTPAEQSSNDPQATEQKTLELKKELERKTLLLVEEVIAGATTLKLPENRALIQSSVADLIWERDEKRARALFREALDNLKQATPLLSTRMSDEQKRALPLWRQQRKEVLQLVARHDADYALELLRATRLQPLPGQLPNQFPADEEGLEQTLAIQVAVNDPERALAMAEKSLSTKGLSMELLHLLSHLNEKDEDLAKQLANTIISKLRSENLATNVEAAWLASVFLRMGAHTEEPGSFVLGNMTGGKPYILDERQLRDLLEMVTGAALTPSAHNVGLTFLYELMPEVEKYFPERVPALRRLLTASASNRAPQERVYFEYQDLLRHGTVEALIAAAAKEPEYVQETLYQQAAWKVLHEEKDAERARQIINDNVRNSARREQMLRDLDRVAFWEAARREQIEEVRRLITRIKSADERAGALIHLAYSAATKKEKKLALQLLEEARPLVSFKPRSDIQLYLLLQMARAYALVEPARAFEIIEPLVEQGNELLSAASTLSGFFLPSGIFRKGEIVLPMGYANAGLTFRQFGKELAALARLNFERTKAAADKFQRHEARLIARLFIAQSLISDQIGFDGSSANGRATLKRRALPKQ